MITERKKTLSIRKVTCFPENDQRREFQMSNRNSNQINVPQVREAMDRFKMQAAQDEGVLFTS